MQRRIALSVVALHSLFAGAAVAAGSAEATLKPTQGNNVTGKVTFSEQAGKVRMVATVSGLTPGQHGFHVHEKGDCSAPDLSSAGGHFNPGSEAHGDPHKSPRHAGDIPMLVADAGGKAQLTFDLSGVTLANGPTSLLGKSVVVHADPDDYASQPAGKSGARIACGVIAPGK